MLDCDVSWFFAASTKIRLGRRTGVYSISCSKSAREWTRTDPWPIIPYLLIIEQILTQTLLFVSTETLSGHSGIIQSSNADDDILS